MSNLYDEILADVRHEKSYLLFKRFSIIASALLVFFLIIGGGYMLYGNWRDGKIAQTASEYYKLYVAVADNDQNKIAHYMAATSPDNNNYSALAQLEEAKRYIVANDLSATSGVLRSIIANNNYDTVFRQYAQLKLIAIEMNTNQQEKLEELIEQLNTIVKRKTIFYYSALELLAYAYLKIDMPSNAKNIWRDLVDDVKAPQDIKERSNMALLLGSR